MKQIIKITLVLLFGILTFTTSALSKDNNIRSYTDRGIKYYPRYVKKGTIKYAKASWYGKPFHGRLTANGERYNMYKMTAAHRTYAMGTILKVTSLKNWRSVIVRVNDRGPFYASRAIDLSYGAAKKLGFVKKGIEKIKIEVLSSKRKVKYQKKQYSAKKEITKTATKNNVIRSQKIQVASFFSKKNASSFKNTHNLKHAKIVKHYIKRHKKTAYKIIVHCTPWEANKLLNSNKFSGAYKV
jgi:rare lipoprotein A